MNIKELKNELQRTFDYVCSTKTDKGYSFYMGHLFGQLQRAIEEVDKAIKDGIEFPIGVDFYMYSNVRNFSGDTSEIMTIECGEDDAEEMREYSHSPCIRFMMIPHKQRYVMTIFNDTVDWYSYGEDHWAYVIFEMIRRRRHEKTKRIV